MTRIDKVLLALVIVIVLALVVLAGRLYQRTNECEKNGGLMVRTIDGFRCVKDLKL